MNPPDRGSRSSYGGSAQGRHQQAAFPFVVDPTEGPPGASAVAVRAFFQAPEGDREPSSAERQQRYGACRGAQISLGHGMHRYHQFGVEGNQDGGTSGSLPRHSSSPPGFFSSPIVYNAYWRDRLKIWGYDPLFLRVDQQSGFAALKKMLEGETTVVVGPSGVGKSSLINALRCNQDISEEDPIHKLVEQGNRAIVVDEPGVTRDRLYG